LQPPAQWPPALALAITALAVHRTTRLLVTDEITRPARAAVHRWVERRAAPRAGARTAAALGYLIECPWCASVWVAAGMVTAAALAWPVVAWPYAVAAASSITGLLADREG
jgi:hypothetical protein